VVMLSAEPRRHRGSESKHPEDACASMPRQGILAKSQGGAGIHACVKDHLQSGASAPEPTTSNPFTNDRRQSPYHQRVNWSLRRALRALG
jgi:hypothetical protein